MRAFSDGEQKTSADVLLDVVMERNINKAYALRAYRMVEKNPSMKLSAEEVGSRNLQIGFLATKIVLEGNGHILTGNLVPLLVETTGSVGEWLIVLMMLTGKSMIDIVRGYRKTLPNKNATEFHVQSGHTDIGRSALDPVMVELG